MICTHSRIAVSRFSAPEMTVLISPMAFRWLNNFPSIISLLLCNKYYPFFYLNTLIFKFTHKYICNCSVPKSDVIKRIF